MLLFAFAFTPGVASSRSETPIVVFEGQGPRRTAEFSVDVDAWRVRWRTGKPGSRIELLAPDGEMLSIVTSGDRSSEGASVYFRGGTFRLRIETAGNWRITVEPL